MHLTYTLIVSAALSLTEKSLKFCRSRVCHSSLIVNAFQDAGNIQNVSLTLPVAEVL